MAVAAGGQWTWTDHEDDCKHTVPGAVQCGYYWPMFMVKCELPAGHELTPCYKHMAKDGNMRYLWMV